MDVGNTLLNVREFFRGQRECRLSVTDYEKVQVRNAQGSIPPGGLILTSLRNGHLLDFSRNTIWSLDWPGMASPPPGIPLPADARVE